MDPECGGGEWQAAPPGWHAAPPDREHGQGVVRETDHRLPPLDLAPDPPCRDYGPRPWLEYIVDLAGPTPCCRNSLLSVFTEPVLEELGRPELYGRAVDEVAWTFAGAAEVPECYAELALGWNLAPRCGEPPDAWTLRRHGDRLVRLLRPLDRRPRPREAARQAQERGAALNRFREDWDVGVALVLRAPWLRRFDTREIWDAADALGMEWGHLALFHWHNQPGLPGDEYLISLWSVEAPGTFAPERAAAGMTVPEIALGFSIPRSPDPVGVFDRMVAAGRYFQARLGGKLLVGQVAIASERVLRLWRGRVQLAAGELTRAGFSPGSAKAMQLF